MKAFSTVWQSFLDGAVFGSRGDHLDQSLTSPFLTSLSSGCTLLLASGPAAKPHFQTQHVAFSTDASAPTIIPIMSDEVGGMLHGDWGAFQLIPQRHAVLGITRSYAVRRVPRAWVQWCQRAHGSSQGVRRGSALACSA